MFVSTLFLGLSAKLMLESTRLQPGNLYYQKNEDFESLVNSNRISQNFMVGLTGKIYPVQLIISSTISIMIASGVANETINYLLKQNSDEENVFQFLPSLDR